MRKGEKVEGNNKPNGRLVIGKNGKPVMVKPKSVAPASASGAGRGVVSTAENTAATDKNVATKTVAQQKIASNKNTVTRSRTDSIKKVETKIKAKKQSLEKSVKATKVGKAVKNKVGNKNGDNKKYIYILAGVIALIVVLIVAIVLVNATRNNNDGEAVEAPVDVTTTEEENAITKQVMDKYVEINVDGYQRVDNEDGLNDVVVIRIKNTSDERTNLALDVVALDDAENVLDKTSLYAEGIEPGQEQIFQAFALSELTPEQLKNAHYKVYRANTYTVDVVQGNEVTQDETIQENGGE